MKKTIKLFIIDFMNELNANNQLALICDSHECNPKGVYQISEKLADNLARKAGAYNSDFLHSAIMEGVSYGDACQVEIEIEHVQAGDTYVTRTGETGTFTKTHWRTNVERIILSETAADYLTGRRIAADEMILVEMRKERAARRKRKNVVQRTIKEDAPETPVTRNTAPVNTEDVFGAENDVPPADETPDNNGNDGANGNDVPF